MKILLSILLAFSLSYAAFSQEKEPSKADMAKAKKLFIAANKSYEAKSYEQALTDFQEAYKLSQKPEFLYNIAQCQRELGKKEEALASYKEFIEKVPESEVRGDAMLHVSDLKEELEKQKIPPKEKPAKEHPEKKLLNYKTLFIGTAASAALATSAGVITLVEVGGVKNGGVIDANANQAGIDRAILFGAITDGLIVVTAAGAGATFWLWHKSKKDPGEAASLRLSPTGAVVSLRF